MDKELCQPNEAIFILKKRSWVPNICSLVKLLLRRSVQVPVILFSLFHAAVAAIKESIAAVVASLRPLREILIR